MIHFGQFITRTSRRKGIEMIKEKGENEFVKFMAKRDWVTNELPRGRAPKYLKEFALQTYLLPTQRVGELNHFLIKLGK